ncbi:MAG: restriction endonuclease subunit S [Bacteroidota bacterium]
MSEWSKVKLGDLADEVTMGPFGSDIKRENFVSMGTPVVRGLNLNYGKYVGGEFVYLSEEKKHQLRKAIATPGQLVFTHRGTIGQVALVPKTLQEVIVSQSQLRLKLKPNVNSEFVFYFLQSEIGRYELLKHSAQVGVPSIASPTKAIRDIDLPLPSLPIQTRIAEILGALDEKIELNRQMSRTLEEMARTLFRRWFVEFEFPDENGEPYKSAGGAMVDSEMGEIPQGWEVTKFGKEFTITMGQSPPGSTYNELEEGLPFFQGRADFGTNFPLKRIYCSEPKRTAERGSSLLSVRAPVGDINIALESCCIGRGLAALAHSYQSYGHFLLKSNAEFIKSYNSAGTVFGAINGNQLADIQIVHPRNEVAEGYEAYAFIEQLERLFIESQTLSTLRDTLLPKLMSGQIDVSGVPL